MKTFKEIMNSKQADLTLGDSLKVSLVISGICMIPALVVAAKEIYNDHEWRKSLKKSMETIDEVKEED